MALGKIISVKNIGRFLNAAASGDVTFRHNTLVFAPNGRGKTTLCAILRSLKHGEPAYITGRRSLGSPDQPEVRFLLDNNRVNFNNGAWSETLPELASWQFLMLPTSPKTFTQARPSIPNSAGICIASLSGVTALRWRAGLMAWMLRSGIRIPKSARRGPSCSDTFHKS